MQTEARLPGLREFQAARPTETQVGSSLPADSGAQVQKSESLRCDGSPVRCSGAFFGRNPRLGGRSNELAPRRPLELSAAVGERWRSADAGQQSISHLRERYPQAYRDYEASATETGCG